MNRRELEDCIRDEVAEWPGVTVEFENATGTGHPKAKLMFGNLILRRPYASNPSDAYHGLHKCLADMRRVLKQLGAERAKPEPSNDEIEQRYRKAPPPKAPLVDMPKGDPSTPGPDVADQLVKQGAATPDQAKAARRDLDVALAANPPMVEDEGGRERKFAEFQALVESIEDGIYFDLPAEVYHAIRALGSGSISDLIVSAGTFWRGSWLDPDRPELDEDATKAQILGKAYHIARLEPERFEETFVREPAKSDFPAKGLLTSDVAVKAALKDLGEQQTVTGESTEDRCERLLDAGYEGTIWPLVKARWDKTVAGRIPIPAKFWDDIKVDMDRLRGSGEIAELLTGGFAEVSIIWTDRYGLRCKARLDYLKPDLWDDFKTFANPNSKVLAQAIADAFRYNRYYTQAVHYRDGVEAMRIGGLQIKGEASDAQRALIAGIQMRPAELDCWYVFQEKGGVPNLIARRFEFFAVPNVREHEIKALVAEGRQDEVRALMTRPTAIHQLARTEIEQAKKTFALYSQVYRPGQPWAPIEPMGTIGDDDFSPFWLGTR